MCTCADQLKPVRPVLTIDDRPKLPLFRWINVPADFAAAGGSLQDMNPCHQAFFLSLAAMVARTSTTKAVFGRLKDACARGEAPDCNTRNEDFANGMLFAAKGKLEESHVFTSPSMVSLRSAAALQTIHQLLIGVFNSLSIRFALITQS